MHFDSLSGRRRAAKSPERRAEECFRESRSKEVVRDADLDPVKRVGDVAGVAEVASLGGFGYLRGGGFQVSGRTAMPGVTPAMWNWWFGWHGSDSRRYKLWHPRAHVSARWADGDGDGHWVGRTSLVEEYLGSSYTKAAISFVEPAVLGLGETGGDLVVCARLGSTEVPVDIGWLVHHVRVSADGAEMRSRFWMGGPHIGVRKGNRLVDNVIRPIATHQLPDPRDLLVHCAQEMNHLAGFLPELHAQLS